MNNFKKYIYIKKCSHCDLKYLGIHDFYAQTPMKNYPGSGDYWSAHLNYHKCKETNLFLKLFTNEEYYYKCCDQLSIFLNIVKDNNFANLCPETGSGGGGDTYSKLSEDRQQLRCTIFIKAIKKYRENLSEDKKKERNKNNSEIRKKYHKNLSKQGKKKLNKNVSIGMQNMSKEKKEKKSKTHSEFMKNVPKLQCNYCSRKIGGGKGNLDKHEKICKNNI